MSFIEELIGSIAIGSICLFGVMKLTRTLSHL